MPIFHYQPAVSVRRYTIFDPDGTLPSGMEVTGDAGAYELGVKFRARVPGWVIGIRFYKFATTFDKAGRLWSAGGDLLGTTPNFVETSSGWQQSNFVSPILIAADTTYVASYSVPATSNSYAAAPGFFTTVGQPTGTTFSFANFPPDVRVGGGAVHWVDGVADTAGTSLNGVFSETPGTFPSGSFHMTNYWLDVSFEPQ